MVKNRYFAIYIPEYQSTTVQVKIWRRSYDIRPPAITEDDPEYPGKDRRYALLAKDQIPLTECLKDTVDRFLPYWHDNIVPALKYMS